MVRLRERPRWKRRLYLEYIAVDYKNEIMIEGYMVLFLALTSPIWGWFVLLPYGCRAGKQSLINRSNNNRRAPYGGINIAERNTARPRLGWPGWFRRRRSLSQGAPSRQTDPTAAESPLLGLPEEIRRQIFLYLIQPADKLTICTLGNRKRLVAVPTHVWQDFYADALGTRRRWDIFLRSLYVGLNVEATDPVETCKDMLALAKVNRSLYREVLPLLYGENVFNFHPLHNTGHAGSIEHFLAFTYSIPAVRFRDIRHIRLVVNFNFRVVKKKQTYRMNSQDEYRWKRTCQALKAMDSLVTLQIRVQRPRYDISRNVFRNMRPPVRGEAPEKEAMMQLVGVKARRECFVEVPWFMSVVGEMPGAEFELREVEGAVDVVDPHLLPC